MKYGGQPESFTETSVEGHLHTYHGCRETGHGEAGCVARELCILGTTSRRPGPPPGASSTVPVAILLTFPLWARASSTIVSN